MNALDILKKDHQTIFDLFADARTYIDMKRLFPAIKNELETHAHIEETIFYPEYQRHDRLKDLVQDAETQHALIKDLLEDLDNQEGPEFENSFQTLMAEVQLHITEEENEIFPQIRSLVDGPDLGDARLILNGAAAMPDRRAVADQREIQRLAEIAAIP